MNDVEIKKTIDLIKGNGLVEVRIIGHKSYSGYFKDTDNLLKKLKAYDNENIYIVLNDIDEACYSRSQSERIEPAKNTTSDNDIQGRDWLLIDIDPKRPSGVSATDEEKGFAKEIGNKVYKFLRDVGFPKPITADSGNGVHLLYKISLANTPEVTDLIKKVLLVLDMLFSTDEANIDTAVFNSSRITKLYGTMARKGANTPDRPHRESTITGVPDQIQTTDVSLLRKVAAMFPEEDKRSAWTTERFDLNSFISRHHIDVKSVSSFSGGTKYILDHCLFDESHKGKDAAIFQLNSGAIGYKCFHNSCSGYKWQDVRRKLEPDAYDRQILTEYERFNTRPQPKKAQDEEGIKGKKFLQMHEIKPIDRENLVYIPSHVKELDRKIIGFLRGETSIWSGVNSSGKSSILGQMALNAVNDGFRVMMYSGELQPHRVKNWLQLQAAGRQFTQSTQWENLFYVPERTGADIDLWMKDKFYLYNNNYGSEYGQLIADLSERLESENIDVVILDNIMTLDLDEMGKDDNGKQKSAILSLSALAKKYDCHIHIVAHPRKSIKLLRKDDISGTSNLSNTVDNVFIIHRVNNDFIRLSNEYFGAAEASWLHKFTNIIEVCKNRDLGVQDYMVGTYFERESKRFLNDPFENIVYGWQDVEVGDDYTESDIPFTETKTPLPF